MVDAASKAFFHLLARSRGLQRLASRYGLRTPRSFARRFIAGETTAEAIAAARALESRGLWQTLDYLGESVSSAAAADKATREYLAVISDIVAAGIGRNISLKLTQLGLDLDRVTAIDNLRRILEPATTHGFFVRIDMENSPYTEVTIEIFETLWGLGYRNLGVVLQSALHRTPDDLERVLTIGGRVRLVKGAYKEPASVAHQRKADVDSAYVTLMETLLKRGTFPAIATHDEAIIEHAIRFADEHAVPRDAFEFQMLYGVRPQLQLDLAARGYKVLVATPYGPEWYPYLMRRLGERPANALFLLRNLVRS